MLMAGENHVRKAAALRGQRQYADAIAEIENNRAGLDDSTLVPGLLQAMHAAEEGGLDDKAAALAKEVALEDPSIPSIKKYL